MPEDLLFTLTGDGALKNFDGESITSIALPRHIQPELFRQTIRYMLKEHEENNTPFYKTISTAPLSADDFKKLYRQYKRNIIKQNGSLLQLGVVVSDYLTQQQLFKSKRAIASFLFEYFAVFKLLKIRKPKPFPKNYSDLVQYYLENGLSSETVRLMMKEAAEVGEI